MPHRGALRQFLTVSDPDRPTGIEAGSREKTPQKSPLPRRKAWRVGTPGRIRTCDPRLRRPMLYPAELRARALESTTYGDRDAPPGRSGQRRRRGLDSPRCDGCKRSTVFAPGVNREPRGGGGGPRWLAARAPETPVASSTGPCGAPVGAVGGSAAGAFDAGVGNRSTLTVHAGNGQAAVSNGPPARRARPVPVPHASLTSAARPLRPALDRARRLAVLQPPDVFDSVSVSRRS